MKPERFDLLGPVRQIEVIAAGRGVRVTRWLTQKFGPGRWRKMKGIALVRDSAGNIYDAEIHWYEAHSIGKVDWKIKRPIR